MSQQAGYFPQVIVPSPKGQQQPSQDAPPHIAPATPGMVTRVLPVGASLEELLNPYGFSTWQRNSRRKGEASIYNPSLSPDRPVQFPMATFEIPKTMGLFLTMIELRAYTFSGIAAEDTVEVDPGNLTTSLAFDLTYGINRPFNSESEITPLLIAPSDAVAQRVAQRSEYYINSALSGQSAASGVQKGLLPFDFMRPGSDVGPLSVYVSNQAGRLNVSAFVFQPLNLPVAFFEVKLAGYLTNQTVAEQVLDRMKALLSCPPLAVPLGCCRATNPRSAFARGVVSRGREGKTSCPIFLFSGASHPSKTSRTCGEAPERFLRRPLTTASTRYSCTSSQRFARVRSGLRTRCLGSARRSP